LAHKRMRKLEKSLRKEYYQTETTTITTEMIYIIDHRLHKIASSASALLKHKDKLPQERIQEYYSLIQDYLQKEPSSANTHANKDDDDSSTLSSSSPLTEEQLLKASQVNYKIPNPDYISGPDLVMKSLLSPPTPTLLKEENNTNDGDHNNDDNHNHDTTNTKMIEFIQSWRKHFQEKMQPQHLPVGWSVDSPVQCDMRSSSS